ncbi:coiled-coil domain-containing protein 73 isoform X2 [Heliangelus exortis]|uniref:coiled-coil domain-containing protein 73 isoform X2 n=1 Tax=Heliangelus exortis TaxID=472823 RepID=UPI003A8D8A43
METFYVVTTTSYEEQLLYKQQKQVLRMDEDFKTQALDSTLQSPSETLLAIRLLDFKTSLLEAIEELRIRREAEINYEDQISKMVVEKQELEWQKETLQHQTDTLQQQNKEAMAAFKKQLQARMFAMEEEKGKYQLAVETKEKEIDGLKEALKALQISKYTLQKKLNEMDQKLQMHLTAKEEHHKKLNEVERCYATIACQFGVVKGVHGKLEQSVQEAIQLNKKLTSVNKRQETEINNLKEELKKVTTDLIRSKVTSQYRVGEENINLAVKEKQFQELQQKIRMETAVGKKVQEENAHIKEEKLEILSSLQCMQELLQRITQANVRMEGELNALKEEYQTLERDNELQREKAKENEEKFFNLQNEHAKALRTWKKDEENMRKEIDTIKNELSLLKGVHRNLEDYPPPQGNHHSEQVENLKIFQEHSKDSEMQAIQKENECMQSLTRQDGNFGHEEETEGKTTTDKSLSIEELQTEQNLQVIKNSLKDEINVTNPSEEKQGEDSSRNSLCTDTNLITQEQTSEIHVTGCKEAENLGPTCTKLVEKNTANLDQKLQDSTEPLASCHMPTRKVFVDSTDPIGAYKKNGSQETDSSKQDLCKSTDELICTKADKNSSNTQHKKSISAPEAPKPKSETVLCAEKNAVCEEITDNHQAKELSFGIVSYIKENTQTEYQKCSLLDSENYVGNALHKTEKTSLNPSGLERDELPFKQICIDAEERNDDSARNVNRNRALRSSGVPATDVPKLPTVLCGNASCDTATKEHSDNMSLLGAFNLCLPKIQRGKNMDDVGNKQPQRESTDQPGNVINKGKESTDQPGNVINKGTHNTEAISPVKDGTLEKNAHEKTQTDNISIDKLIPCKKVNDDIQIHSNERGYSLEINNSKDNALLKDSLNSTVPGRKFAEGHLKESCSLAVRTSGNLVNISGRSSFDLSTLDKKAEKTPVCLDFLVLSSCSRVNQMRGQATWASKAPSLFKLPCSLENTKAASKIKCQNLSETVDGRETGLGSTSFKRTANTLNTSSNQRDPQGDPSEEWNAGAKTFYDSSFPTEHMKEELQHEKSPHKTVTPASENALRDEESCSTCNSIVQNQTEETEKFLNLERIHSARKRKYEEGQ